MKDLNQKVKINKKESHNKRKIINKTDKNLSLFERIKLINFLFEYFN